MGVPRRSVKVPHAFRGPPCGILPAARALWVAHVRLVRYRGFVEG